MVESESRLPLYFYGENKEKCPFIWGIYIEEQHAQHFLFFCTSNKAKQIQNCIFFKLQTNWMKENCVDEYKQISDEK